MKQILHSFTLRVALLTTLLVGGFTNGAWATSYKAYTGGSEKNSTTISSSNVSSGSVGVISWTGTSCSYSSNRVNIAANGSITFTANTGYYITKIVIQSGSSSAYYGTWTSSPSVTPSSSSGITTFDGLSASSVTVTTSTSFRCTNASSITVHYEAAPSKTSTTLVLSSSNLNDGNLSLTVPNGSTEALTATVTPNGGEAFANPTITWTSSDATVASVSSTGVVTPLKEGTATITASYPGDETYEESSSTCTVTVSDTRTDVNLLTFTADATTLIVGGTPSYTSTRVTNDKAGWTAAYTYSSSNTSVATVDDYGLITAVAKGTATITCSLNVIAEDATYKAGATASMAIDITVNNPTHTVTFSSNGNTYGVTAEVEEGESITLPADNPSVDGKSFRGWVAAQIAGTTNTTPDFVTAPVMGASDVTYYAVFADVVAGSETVLSTSITTSTTGLPTSYGDANTFSEYTLDGFKYKVQQMYKNSNKLQWRAAANSNGTGTMYNTEAISKIQSIVLTYDTSDSNKNFTVKVGDSENPTSGTSIEPTSSDNVYTFDCSSYEYNYFVLTNGSGAGYLTSIIINYKANAPDTYENYCTTVSNDPSAVVILSTDAIEMTWGESGKTLTATVTVDDEEIDETITFTPSSPNLTIDGSGNISCDVPGDYTITASVAEKTGEHQAGQAVCYVTVNKKNIELTFENAEVNMMVTDEEYTQSVTATPTTYDGEITYEITSSTSADALIDEGTGEILFENTGVIEVTATGAATTLYNGNTASYTLYVKTTPSFASVPDADAILFDGDLDVDNYSIAAGPITLTSSNPAVATVDGTVVSGVACGTTIITITADANDTYVAGSTTFELTVSAPGASSTNTAEKIFFNETFNNCSGTGGRDNTFSGNVGTSALTSVSDEEWTVSTRCGGAKQCVKFGTSEDATLTSATISITGNATLTFAGAGWYSGDMNVTVSATGAKLSDDTNVTLEASKWNTYTVNITNASGSVTISFVGHRGFLDDIKITQPITSTSVTTTGGFATYCYQYPLNLDGIDGAKAYKATSVDIANSKVALEQITGTIQGGVPFILKADDADATFEIPLADESTTVPTGNQLVGTLAPTFVAQTSGDYTNFAYSKSNECFVKLGDDGNTVPANRAYLPINLGGDNGVKTFSLSFSDADGIHSTIAGNNSQNATIFNLAGQRLSHLQKGINLVNGKKVLVK